MGHRESDRAAGVSVRDFNDIASRLNLEVTGGSRTRPDGSTLRWQLAGVTHALATGAVPFFIRWEAPSELHPGAAAAQHAVRPRGIAWIEVTAEERALHTWLGHHDIPLRITEGPPALTAVGISTATGEVVLR